MNENLGKLEAAMRIRAEKTVSDLVDAALAPLNDFVARSSIDLKNSPCSVGVPPLQPTEHPAWVLLNGLKYGFKKALLPRQLESDINNLLKECNT